MIEVRALTADDWRVWRALRLTALAESPEAFCTRLAEWQGDGDREERWRARLATAGSRHLVAVVDDEPVGMAAGMPVEGGGVALFSMYVAPRGRGRGVGDALVREVEDWARSVAAPVLRLDVMIGNEVAIALYRRHGFVLIGDQRTPLPDGRREVAMAKRL